MFPNDPIMLVNVLRFSAIMPYLSIHFQKKASKQDQKTFYLFGYNKTNFCLHVHILANLITFLKSLDHTFNLEDANKKLLLGKTNHPVLCRIMVKQFSCLFFYTDIFINSVYIGTKWHPDFFHDIDLVFRYNVTRLSVTPNNNRTMIMQKLKKQRETN